jgi:hypothetical protein
LEPAGTPAEVNGKVAALALFESTGARIGSAGRITETSTPARQIQVALRWSF